MIELAHSGFFECHLGLARNVGFNQDRHVCTYKFEVGKDTYTHDGLWGQQRNCRAHNCVG